MKSTAVLAAAAVFAFSAAHADTVTIDWASPVIQPGPVDSVSWGGTSAAGTGSANAGRFRGIVTSFTGSILTSEFVDSQSTLYAYCYDLLQSLHSGTYTIDYTVPTRTLDWLGAVNYVLNGNSNLWIDAYAWLHPANGNVGAAIQIGIWESLYESTGWSLASGDITFSGLDAATLAAYASFKTAVENAGVNDLAGNLAMIFESDGNQDIITGRRPARRVPEPASLVLFGLAAALGGWSLRRKL